MRDSFFNEAVAQLALQAVPGLGVTGIRRLVHNRGSAVAAWESLAATEYANAVREMSGWASDPSSVGAALLSRIQAAGGVFIYPGHKAWPTTWLEGLDFPPPFLIARGQVELLQAPVMRLAIVGSRSCTPYGREQARRFGSGIAAGGGIVISGAARGIDQCAMQGALSAGGAVISVMASGLDEHYPPGVTPLLDAIVGQGGLILTEFPMGMKPLRQNFLRRNRLIAALSHGTLVVQATKRSGSLNTAGWALSLGRDLFGLPGNIDSSVSEGVHRMLQDGAHLVTSPLDILDAMGLREETSEPPELAVIAERDLTLEAMALELGQEPELLQMRLVELELAGYVLRLPGGLYHRSGPGARIRPDD